MDAETDIKLSAARQPNSEAPQWVYRVKPPQPRPDTVLVFVHGIFGDTLGTWENVKTGRHFYDLIVDDPRFQNKFDVFAFGFTSNMMKAGSLRIGEAANRLASQLQGQEVLDYKRVVFVAHSMGGLVVMKMLLTRREYLPRVPLIVFFSTPQEGAEITRLARLLLNNPALEGMLPANGNDSLQELSDQWRSLSPKTRPHIECAYEKLPTAGVMIVGWSSATRFCDGPAVPIEADHIDIVKPKDAISDDSYQTLANALLNLNRTSTSETPPSITITQHNENSSGTNIGVVENLTVVEHPKVLIFDENQMKAAAQVLNEHPNSIRLVLPSPVPFMADGRTTPLGNQILALFDRWHVQPVVLGSGPVPQGITIVGKKDSDAVLAVVRAFDAAKIPYTLDPDGWTGPGSLGPMPVTITVSRSQP